MATFLLPCHCSTEVAVTPGQAGGSVACPQCGRSIPVPKLRDLGRLRREDLVDNHAGATWRPAHAVFLLGALLAAASLAGAMWLGRTPAGVVDDAALRSAVLSADDLTVYKAWTEGLSSAGVRRPPADEELALVRRARFADGMRGVLHAVAAGGALAAAGAGLVLWFAGRSAPGREAGPAAGRARA